MIKLFNRNARRQQVIERLRLFTETDEPLARPLEDEKVQDWPTRKPAYTFPDEPTWRFTR